jgi:hypothetical protein
MVIAKVTSSIFHTSRPAFNSDRFMLKFVKSCRLIWTFYRSFFFTSLVVDVCCIHFFLKYGYSVFNALFWFKLITLGLIFYYVNDYKKKEFFYYQNLGLSKQRLWIITLTFDFILFLILLIQSGNFK